MFQEDMISAIEKNAYYDKDFEIAYLAGTVRCLIEYLKLHNVVRSGPKKWFDGNNCFIFGQYKGKNISDVPEKYLKMLLESPRVHLLYVEKVKIERILKNIQQTKEKTRKHLEKAKAYNRVPAEIDTYFYGKNYSIDEDDYFNYGPPY